VKRENVSGSILVHVHIASKVLSNSSIQYKTCSYMSDFCRLANQDKKEPKGVLWFAADFVLPNAELPISDLYTVYCLATVNVGCRLLHTYLLHGAESFLRS
jgi:hypothetical protein